MCSHFIGRVRIPAPSPVMLLAGDGSPKSFFVQIVDPEIVEITLLHKANQTLPFKNPTKLQLYFEHLAFSDIGQLTFIANFHGSAAVCRYFEDLSGKKSFKIHPSTSRIYRIPKNTHTLFVRRTCPLKLLKLKI